MLGLLPLSVGFRRRWAILSPGSVRLDPKIIVAPALLLAVGAVGLLAAVTVTGRSEEPSSTAKMRDPIRDQKIADIEKQIGELNKSLAELKKTETTSMAMSAAIDGAIPADWAKDLQWRCIGPANMGGRITAFSVFEADPTTYWVATASGGLLKTDQQRHHLRAPVRPRSHRLHRRRLRGPVEQNVV